MIRKRTFDLILLTIILMKPAVGLAKMVAARHASEGEGAEAAVAQAALVIL